MACEEQDWRHPLLKVWKEYFKVPPARTTVGTTGLLVKDTLVEIDLIGFVPGNCCFQRWRAGVGASRRPVRATQAGELSGIAHDARVRHGVECTRSSG
jgi:hypothetical protein